MTQSMTPRQKRRYRAIGHHLKPIVTVAGKGLSDTVVQELERALHDHELIKVRITLGDREARDGAIEEINEKLGAALVTRVGNIALLYRPCPQPDPRLSNLLRHST